MIANSGSNSPQNQTRNPTRNIRIADDAWRRAKVSATLSGLSLQDWLTRAIHVVADIDDKHRADLERNIQV